MWKPFWYDIWLALLIEQKSGERRNSSLSLFVSFLKKLLAPRGFLAFLWLQRMLKTWHFHTRTQFHIVWSLTPDFIYMYMYLKALPARTLSIAHERNSLRPPKCRKFNIVNSSVLQEDVKLLRAICSKWPHAKQTAVQQVIDVLADISYFSARFLQQILQ